MADKDLTSAFLCSNNPANLEMASVFKIYGVPYSPSNNLLINFKAYINMQTFFSSINLSTKSDKIYAYKIWSIPSRNSDKFNIALKALLLILGTSSLINSLIEVI